MGVRGLDLEQGWEVHAWLGAGRLQQRAESLARVALPASLSEQCGVATAVLAWSDEAPMATADEVRAALRALWRPVDVAARAALCAAFDAALDARATRQEAAAAAAPRPSAIAAR